MCRYIAQAVLILVLLKELVKVGVVLYAMVQPGGKTPLKLRRSAVSVVVSTLNTGTCTHPHAHSLTCTHVHTCHALLTVSISTSYSAIVEMLMLIERSCRCRRRACVAQIMLLLDGVSVARTKAGLGAV